MALDKANDKYRATLRATYIAGTSTTIDVTAIPTNVPTLVTLGWNTANQAVFRVTGTSGTTSANYSLTGITFIKGFTGNLADGTAVNCLNHEEFFNQYSSILASDFIQLDDKVSNPASPAATKVIFFIKNGSPFVVNSSGTVTQIGFKSDAWIDVADAATMTFDLSETVKRLKFRTAQLTANRTFALSNVAAGMVFMVRVKQDVTASRIPVWPTVSTDTVTMTIAAPAVVTTTKDIKTGTPIKLTTTGALPTGLAVGTVYYWIRTAATTGNLATSRVNALAGTTITTTGSQSGVHTMSIQILWAGGSEPAANTTKYGFSDYGFVVDDLNQITGTVIAEDM